jgi:glycosyltransferase involved in cell wall biosynthesis
MRLELLNNVTWINPDNVIVLENPVEVEVIERLSLDAFEDAVDILAVGRLVKEKAYDVLLDAFSLVLVRYPTRKLTIIGSGDQFEQISEKINALKLQDHVFLKGALKNPYVYMKHSNVSVLSSRLEGFPNVLFEMMTLSQSVVSTICADGIEALPGIYTSPVDSADQLADAIVAALEEDNKTKNDNILKMRAKVTSLTVPNFINSIFLKLDQNSSNILE